jgi:hypothetical protein
MTTSCSRWCRSALLLLLGLVPVQVTAQATWWANPWNGHLVYLSPATHGLPNGGQGECLNGNEDWLNFDIGWSAAHHQWGLLWRGYDVVLGANMTNQQKINDSNAMGATIHIPLHSNAHASNQVDCGNTNAARFGTVVIYRDGSAASRDLATRLRTHVGDVSPGTNDYICQNPGHPCTSVTWLGELHNVRATPAYLESEFHTWNTGVLWLDRGFEWAWRIAYAVDEHLNFPPFR